MRRLRPSGLLVTVAALLLGYAAWSGPAFAESKPITLIYVSALNCPPCIAWTNRHKSDWESSRERQQVDYKIIEAYSAARLGQESAWPEDLRWLRDELRIRRGAPRWVVIHNGEIVMHAAGLGTWVPHVLPLIRQLVATENAHPEESAKSAS